jgi:hypothetical protein
MHKFTAVLVASIITSLPMWVVVYFDGNLYFLSMYISWLICTVAYDVTIVRKGLMEFCRRFAVILTEKAREDV